MKRSTIVAGGAGLGFGLMYFLDPNSGRRRRALVRDRAGRLTRDSRELLDKASRDFRNRAQGLRHLGSQILLREEASDNVVVARVRSRLGRACTHPSAIQVSAREGVVILRGPVLEDEVRGILSAAAAVRGVREVRNELELHAQAGDISALQGGRRRRASRNWLPAARISAAAAGAGLLAFAIGRRKALGAAAGLAGAALLTRGMTNTGLRQMLRRGGERAQQPPRAFERKLELDAPPERVFRFLSSLHNLPQFLPSIREIRQEPGDHVWGIMDDRGRRRELNGYFRPTEESRRIDWGSDGAPMYRGWLQVEDAGGNRSRLTIHIEHEGMPMMDQMVDRVLGTIRRLVEQEGAGGIIGEERRAA
jgi:uncharacterized membrane protein